jgi:hypothetical protein
MQNIFGILSNGVHIDVSKTERGAKQYATKNNYDTVTIRYNGGYVAEVISKKEGGKWKRLNTKNN